MLQAELAARVGEVLGSVPSISSISRCLSGESPTLELVTAISEVLALPPPVFVAASRSEAIAFQRERLLQAVDAQRVAIAAKISSQPRTGQADRAGAGRRRVERGRPKTP